MRGSIKNDNEFFYVKIKGLKKDEKTPYFEFQQKKEEAYEVVDKQNSITGCVDRPIKIKHFQYEGKDCIEYRISITDAEEKETYILSLGNSGIARNILNSIMSLGTLLESISISLYVNKSKKDNKEYKQVSVRSAITDEFIPWKFPILELNAMMDPIQDKKGITVKNDTSRLDEFMESQVVKWNEKFKTAKKPTVTQEKNESVEKEKTTIQEQINGPNNNVDNINTPPVEESDDLPF